MAERFTGLASRHVDGLKHVLDSVPTGAREAVKARLAAIVTFLGEEDSEAQNSGPFARAAIYLAEHPELAVAGVDWDCFEDEDGRIMYRLDVEVTPRAFRIRIADGDAELSTAVSTSVLPIPTRCGVPPGWLRAKI